ncbi:DUF2062 domain-containing protein [Sphingomonas sp. KR1UV-12]|uniref:DUF2062 domain-containing protein n=1 Tax=Sphingomonas aurea TaxID=3063994 RepID=A0ABT9EHB1_9SPHN|nr:DUF2062 domain-containing protein [Sphingomonas sp. KR1UV-12]MDP1026350.1 DUF2062 domain-containing protein [Sphingomonas sp. KR1UV-12]
MASAPPTLWQRSVGWCRRNLPTRESMEANRLLRPVAHRVLAPELWRFTRRSVPRGVALGMVAGFLFPVAQIAIAAVFALPFRANVPVAALTTFITNPLTTPILWFVAYRIGAWLIRTDVPIVSQPVQDAATGWLQWATSWLHWLWDKGPAFGLGLLVLTVAAAALGYALSALGWRLWIARKWRHRRHALHDGKVN